MEYLCMCFQLLMFVAVVQSEEDEALVARDVLKTIAPINQHVQLPPGFPTVNTISTEKFRYKSSGSKIEVSANLDETITMFPGYVTITNIKLDFLYDKKKKGDWKAKAKGTWEFGSSTLDVEVTPNGTFSSSMKSIKLTDITKKFLNNNNKDIGIAASSFSLKDVQIKGEISRTMDRLELSFRGTLKNSILSPIPVDITVAKLSKSSAMHVYTVLEFKNIQPEKVLKELLSQKTLSIPFFSNLLMSSDLFSSKKKVFGVAFSYSEIFYYKRKGVSSEILTDVLQSHIPEGVTLLFPIEVKQKKKKKRKTTKRDKSNGGNENTVSDAVNIAFVINNPVFDLLISQQNRVSVTDILPVLSKELSVSSKDVLPNFAKDLDNAYSTHVSFDWSTTDFTVFIRLQETVELVPNILRIEVTNLVLQKKMLDLRKESKNKTDSWKISAKGNFTMGSAKFQVQYSQIDSAESFDDGKIFGLTGTTDKMSLDDIIDEFNPEFYPNTEVKDMIENTEISTLELYDIKLYSRVQKQNGTPHLLMIGYTDLPQWEKNIQVAILIFRRNESWECKWAISLKHSPLSSVVEALTGFETSDLLLLHNNHIMTTLISSPLPSMAKLPPHIITTPLLRLPVEKGLSVIALLRFPDNCGDDKMCEAASSVLDTGKLFTAKGQLSTKEFKIQSNVVDDIQFSDHLKGVNNTLEFTIGNNSRLDVQTSVIIPQTSLIFDGPVHIYKTGDIQLQMRSRTKRWLSPFSLRTISFKNLNFVADYENGQSVQKIDLKGTVLLGLQGNGGEIEAAVRILYNPGSPSLSTFYSNFTDIRLTRLLDAFTLDVKLPSILEDSSFPNGLMLTYSGQEISSSDYSLHGDLNIFGRLLYCAVSLKHPGYMKIVTENSPAPVIFAHGLIIVQQNKKSKLRGPKIIAEISHRGAKVIMKGYVKLLGIESEVEMDLKDSGIEFTIAGKLMNYEETRLTAYSTRSPESFYVRGCLPEVSIQVQYLLVETILKSANQSVINMKKSEENYLNAQRFFLLAVRDEQIIRTKRDSARIAYEDGLIDYGKYVVKTNEVCPSHQCGYKCFGCPKLNQCCRIDIFGHCIACPTWKKCCWKNIDPLCIAKQDGCHVIKAQAEKELAAKEARIVQQRIILDNLEQFLTKAEVEKGKHRAVLEAAIDAKQIVEEDSTPGLNAHDTIRKYGAPYGWAKVNSICYDTSIIQAATGCIQFILNVEFFDRGLQRVSIWSCLKEDLVTELTESLANYVFPNMVDTSADSITEVASRLNGAETEIQNEVTDNHQIPISITGRRPDKNIPGIISLGNYTSTGTFPKYNNTIVENLEFDVTSVNVTENVPDNGNLPNIGKIQPINIHSGTSTISPGDSLNQNIANTTDKPNPNIAMQSPADQSSDQLFPVKNPIKINTKHLNSEGNNIENEQFNVAGSTSGEEVSTSLDGLSTSGEDDRSSTTISLAGENQDGGSSRENQDDGSNSADYSGEDDVLSAIQNERITKQSTANKTQGSSMDKIDEEYSGDHQTEGENSENNVIALDDSFRKVNRNNNVIELDDSFRKVNRNNNKEQLKVVEKYNNNNNSNAVNDKNVRYNTTNIYPYVYPAVLYSKRIPLQQHQQGKTNQNVTQSYKELYGQYYYPAVQFGVSNINTEKRPQVLPNVYTDHGSVTNKKRSKRSIDDVLKSDSRLKDNTGIFHSNPFWDIHTDHNTFQTRYYVPTRSRHEIFSRVIEKRWSIPENPNGKCHIFHQLISICKDMAETIVTMDRSLKEAIESYKEENKNVYLELFETEESLVAATKRVSVSNMIAMDAAKTLGVVREGVNIWSKRCSNEFEWQKQTGAYAWFQSMDLRIQQLGGYGVFRFLDNLFNAFQALFENDVVDDLAIAENYAIIEKTRQIAEAFRKIFKHKLDVPSSRDFADNILSDLEKLKKIKIPFCH